MRDLVRSLLAEPRVPRPPARSRWDWLLAAALSVLTVVGALFSDHSDEWRALTIALTVWLPFAVLWRRSHPLIAFAVFFGVLGPANVVSQVVADEAVGFEASFFTGMILTYALLRWASGREAAIGVFIIVVTFTLTDALDPTVSAIESAIGTLVFLFAGALGAVMRFRSNAGLREIEQARLREREQLARELHDTVAHHVSAIAIQAQAGRTLAASQPEAAAAALAVIEEAASRTLAEMRKMVTALRFDAEPESAPLRSLADVSRLACPAAGGPAVEVELSGDLDDLSPSVEASLYRIAQESITNSRRHARHATRVSVQVEGDDDNIRLTVTDDGDPTARETGSSGFGLVGMTERVSLLGGQLEIGPGPHRGWVVDAVLPRGSAAP